MENVIAFFEITAKQKVIILCIKSIPIQYEKQ